MKKVSDVVVDRLLKYMREQNLTQYKLAQQSGLPFPTIKSIMQRRTKDVSLKTILMITNGLNISVSDFFDDKSFDISNLNLE